MINKNSLLFLTSVAAPERDFPWSRAAVFIDMSIWRQLIGSFTLGPAYTGSRLHWVPLTRSRLHWVPLTLGPAYNE